MARVRSISSSSAGSSSSSAASSSSAGSSSSASSAAVASALNKSSNKQSTAAPKKWKPPAGYSKVVVERDDSIDWNKLNTADNLELWAVRVPRGLKLKHLDGLTIDLDSTGSTPLKTKKGDYVVHTSTHNSTKRPRRDDHDDDQAELADLTGELASVVPLLPAKDAASGNYCYKASTKPISKRLVVTKTAPNLPSLPSHSTLVSSQPSPVPGAVLSAAELRQGVAPETKQARKPQPRSLNLHVPAVFGEVTKASRTDKVSKEKLLARSRVWAQKEAKGILPVEVKAGAERDDAEMEDADASEPRKKKHKRRHDKEETAEEREERKKEKRKKRKSEVTSES